MATDVTVLGGTGTVTVSFASAVNAAAAQTALGFVSDAVTSGFFAQVNYSGTGTVPGLPPGKFGGGVVVTVPGGGILGVLPGGYISAVVNSPSITALVGGSSSNQTVVAGGTGTTAYLNIAQNTQAFFGSGNNYFSNVFDSTSAVINIDGYGSSTVPGAPAAQSDYVDGSHGSATVNLFSGPFLVVQGGGNNIVNLTGNGDHLVGATGSSTVAVTINGVAGANLTYVNQGGAAFINALSSDATVFGATGNTSSTGTQTVIGGTGVITAVGIQGYALGGSSGNNLLGSSSLTSAATLVGGGNNDKLFANFSGQLLQAGSGNESLIGATSSLIGGGTFIGGADSAGNDLIVGNAGGGNQIGVGAGISTVFGLGTHGASDLNTFYEASHGGTHLIEDFFGSDTFKLSASLGTPSVVSIATVTGAGSIFDVTGSKVVLSDGTTLVFNGNTTISNSNFS